MLRETIGEDASPRDLRLEADIETLLCRSGYAALHHVASQARENGDVVLQGNVPSYHLKQLAQSFVRRVVGVRRIENRLAVCPAGELARSGQ